MKYNAQHRPGARGSAAVGCWLSSVSRIVVLVSGSTQGNQAFHFQGQRIASRPIREG